MTILRVAIFFFLIFPQFLVCSKKLLQPIFTKHAKMLTEYIFLNNLRQKHLNFYELQTFVVKNILLHLHKDGTFYFCYVKLNIYWNSYKIPYEYNEIQSVLEQ